ncbi:unnamed protein product [Ostreobium quekettii]|uniref:Uncharacterized protein n=1 Tax=Ostreobium quekettii TaxID=121088 RepID=A0A8S1IPN1_9CHLO|nr:unnamed protein product [Ostreobium quekettii]
MAAEFEQAGRSQLDPEAPSHPKNYVVSSLCSPASSANCKAHSSMTSPTIWEQQEDGNNSLLAAADQQPLRLGLTVVTITCTGIHNAASACSSCLVASYPAIKHLWRTQTTATLRPICLA